MNTSVISAEFNLDQMLMLQQLLKVTRFSDVLEVRPPLHYIDDERRTAAQADALAVLTQQGVVEGGEVTEPTIAQWIRVLQRPDIELMARIWRKDTELGMCVCRRGPLHVVAMRYGDLYTVQPLSTGEEITSVAQVVAPIQAVLGDGEPAAFEPINLLVDEGAAIDRRVAKGANYYQELIAAGVAEPSARFVTDALERGEEVWRSEIGAIEYVPGGQVLSKAGVGVFDTPKGRIIAAPSLALDGRLWSTFAPGTPVRLVKSVELIVETLPGLTWFDPRRL